MSLLAILGPVETAQFMEFFDKNRLSIKVPTRLGTPVNLLCRELLARGKNLLIITLSPEVKDEVILEDQNLKICIGPNKPKRARDFFRLNVNTCLM